MTTFDLDTVMAILREEMPRYQQPLVDAMGEAHQTPFQILIATILSLLNRFSDTHALHVQGLQW
jgi:endonuclease III